MSSSGSGSGSCDRDVVRVSQGGLKKASIGLSSYSTEESSYNGSTTHAGGARESKSVTYALSVSNGERETEQEREPAFTWDTSSEESDSEREEMDSERGLGDSTWGSQEDFRNLVSPRDGNFFRPSDK